MLDEVVQLYGSDFDGHTLKSQLGILQSHFTRSEESVHLSHVAEYLTSLGESCCMILSEAKKLVSLILVLPATNETSECSLCLNHLMLLHVHKDLTDKQDLAICANDFVHMEVTIVIICVATSVTLTNTVNNRM